MVIEHSVDVNLPPPTPSSFWVRFSGGRLLLPVQPGLRGAEVRAGRGRLRRQLVQRQLRVQRPPSGKLDSFSIDFFGLFEVWWGGAKM